MQIPPSKTLEETTAENFPTAPDAFSMVLLPQMSLMTQPLTNLSS